MGEVYFIGGPWDGRREEREILGDYFEVAEMDSWSKMTNNILEPMPVKHYFYTRHWKFKDVFVCQGMESPGVVKIRREVIMSAICAYYSSEFLHSLRCAKSPVLNAKAEKLMKEADVWYKQALHSDGWVYCGEKLIDIIKDYGGVE